MVLKKADNKHIPEREKKTCSAAAADHYSNTRAKPEDKARS